MPRTRPPYPEEFRREAVGLIRSGQRSLAEASESLGVSQQTLRNWLKQTAVEEGRAEGLTGEEREELRRLRRENRVLREEREILKKAAAFFAKENEDPVAVFRFIEAEKANHSVATMCRVLRVSRSGYYAWAARPPSPRAVENVALVTEIRRVLAESDGTYGSRRVHAQLRQ
jgi:transposase-like protein